MPSSRAMRMRQRGYRPGTGYIPCTASEVPRDVRWIVPRRHQGQVVEIAYGTWDGDADEGDPFRRVRDRSGGPVRYYIRADAHDPLPGGER